ncbi:hypothetical protein B0H15DRAFT_952198 [Mycena belliarum]|uniref:Uncharacterized protein n=1 Tax=Mycena belliarum TaxID=1033014 RepID=A0AAD6U151_9AGAR|nr:hypothetical protein B0H15DRAFT_952198 [Mycena belliae]
MLQIPSSAFSLVSLSSKILGLCSNFFPGSKVLYTQLVLSIPQNSSSVTQTAASIWLPTTCALSAPHIPVSCIAIVGYATVVSASLFCILRAKGFPGIASQPPSPPPDSGSSFSVDEKQARSWLSWILYLLIGLVVLSLTLLYWFLDNDGSLPAPMFTVPWIDGLSLMERTFEDGLIYTASFLFAARLHISTHAYQHIKLIILALASHAVCIALALVFEQWRRRAVSLAPTLWLPYCVTIVVPVIIISSFSWLNWIFWLLWHCGSQLFLPTATTIKARIIHDLPPWLLFLRTYELASVSMIAGSTLVHVAISGLSTITMALLGMPHAARHVICRLSNRSLLRCCLCASCIVIMIVAGSFGIAILGTLCIGSSLDLLRLVLWHSVPLMLARAEVQKVPWGMVSEHLEWKYMQIADFHHLVSTLWGLRFSGINICTRTWGGLAWGHQLLIVLPAMIFYSYFYLSMKLAKPPTSTISHSPSHTLLSTYGALGRESDSASPIDGDSNNTTKTIPDVIDARSPKGTAHHFLAVPGSLDRCLFAVSRSNPLSDPRARSYPQLHALCLLYPTLVRQRGTAEADAQV